MIPSAPAFPNLAQHIVKEHGILLMAEHQPALALVLSKNYHLVLRNFWTNHWWICFGQIGLTNAGISIIFNANKDWPSIALHPNSDPCNYLPDIHAPYVSLPQITMVVNSRFHIIPVNMVTWYIIRPPLQNSLVWFNIFYVKIKYRNTLW